MSFLNLRFIYGFFVFSSLAVFANPSYDHVGQLPNGITYYIHHNPSFRKHFSLDLIVRVGSLHEQEDEKGFSHLVEHLVASEMTFKGVKIEDESCPLWDLSNPEAYELTSYEFTQYHLDISRAIPHGLEEGLKSFSSALTTLGITPKNFHEHQRDILDEIIETEQSAAKKWQRKRIDYEYAPYRDKHSLGSISCIQEATLEKVDRFFHRYYQPSRCAIIVIGNMDIRRTEELIQRYFGSLTNASDVEKSLQANLPVSSPSIVYFDPGLEKTTFSMTQIIPRLSKQETFLFSIWTHLLQRYLQTAFSSSDPNSSPPYLETLSYPPLLRLNTSLTDNPQEGILQLKEVLRSFVNTVISHLTDQEFNALKAQVQQAASFQWTTIDGLRDFYRDHFIQQDTNFHPYLEESALEALTLESFRQAARTFQVFSQVSLATNQPVMKGISELDSIPLRSVYDH